MIIITVCANHSPKLPSIRTQLDIFCFLGVPLILSNSSSIIFLSTHLISTVHLLMIWVLFIVQGWDYLVPVETIYEALDNQFTLSF